MDSRKTEFEQRRLVRARVVREHQDDVSLLEGLMFEARNRLGRADSYEIAHDGRRLQMMLLTQSMNAAYCAFGLVTDGYPRMALSFARLLREGHIALLRFVHVGA